VHVKFVNGLNYFIDTTLDHIAFKLLNYSWLI